MLTADPPDLRSLRVGVVLPAFNESRHVAGVAGALPAWIDSVFVVDDASTDDTLVVAQRLTDKRVRAIHHDTNTGVGGAMRTGYAAALRDGCDVLESARAAGSVVARAKQDSEIVKRCAQYGANA
jgi:glycosyltransferase involved in cell wall biosynthesis